MRIVLPGLDSTISYKVVYSSRRTLAISIRPDGTVTVRVPYRTSEKKITKLLNDKAGWIRKHTERIKETESKNPRKLFADGEIHLFRGRECILRISQSAKPCCSFSVDSIEIGSPRHADNDLTRRILYAGYRREANKVFGEALYRILSEKSSYGFKVSKLRIKTMRSRWGSCSGRGAITLNTELVRLPDRFTRYVILHELCHLRHHNHGTGFYNLLEELIPEWRTLRSELKEYVPGR